MVEVIIKLPGTSEQMLEIEDYVGFSLKTVKLSDQSYLERLFQYISCPREPRAVAGSYSVSICNSLSYAISQGLGKLLSA